MTKKYTEYLLLAGAALVGLSLVGTAGAADVNKLVETCANCHGKGGASSQSDVPIIGGYSVEFLTNNLTAYKTKDRSCPDTEFKTGSKKGTKTNMCKMVADLSEGDIKQVAQYYSKQKFVRAKQKSDPALAKKGKEVHDMYCEKCHSEGGTVSGDDSGLPAGQWKPYLKQAFAEITSGKRPIPKKMKLKMEEIGQAEIDALIEYYSSFN